MDLRSSFVEIAILTELDYSSILYAANPEKFGVKRTLFLEEVIQMGKIMLGGGPTTQHLESMREVLEANEAAEVTQRSLSPVGFSVLSADETDVKVGTGGKLQRPEQLMVTFTKIPQNLLLSKHHACLTVVVAEDFRGGPLIVDDVDIGKKGTELVLRYDRVDHSASVEKATPLA